MPFRQPQVSGFVVRLALELSLPFFMLAVLGFAVCLVIIAGVALIRRRFRRTLSLACAAAAIPLFVAAKRHVAIFDPYYWFVLVNEARFEAIARSAAAEVPVFAILETRDVSFGMATTPPRYVSIVYDESDEICCDPASSSSPRWRARNEKRVEASVGGYVSSWVWTRHLHGHFFLLGAG